MKAPDPGTSEVRPSHDQLAASRAQFVANIGERLEALERSIESFRRSRAADQHAAVQRRVHALSAAAGVLGFSDAHALLVRIEQLLGRLPESGTEAALDQVVRWLDTLPSIVLGAAAPESEEAEGERRAGRMAVSAVLVGLPALRDALAEREPGWEVRALDDPARLLEEVRNLAPDVLVVDASDPVARQMVEQVVDDPGGDGLAIVVVGDFQRPEAAAAFLELGVQRIIPRPVSPESLARHLREVSAAALRRRFELLPLGELTVAELSQRLGQEIRRGLSEAVLPAGRETRVSLGDGVEVLAALWSSLARIREVVSLRSGGTVRFDALGPEGAIALAPWAATEERAESPRRAQDSVGSLESRRVIVADDDPSVVGFIGGVLRAAGAEVLEAYNGTQALDLAYQTWPDLVVSDLLMPGLDGFELSRRLKRDVMLSDVPLILLSWKEDLLQRVRELGADADAYLQKEASDSVIVRSVREVLRTRFKIEERFRQGPSVRGRLDTVTPRLVLELAAGLWGDATVAFRDAIFLYEVEMRNGRLQTAWRSALEGESESGVQVLQGLCGIRVGRFSVQRSERSVRSEFEGTLRELSSSFVARARAAQHLVAAPELARLGRVQIDRESIAPYVQSSPERVRDLIEQLTEGASPSLLGQTFGARLVEASLHDLALHGGIREILDTAEQPILTPMAVDFEARSVPLAGPDRRIELRDPTPRVQVKRPESQRAAFSAPISAPRASPPRVTEPERTSPAPSSRPETTPSTADPEVYPAPPAAAADPRFPSVVASEPPQDVFDRPTAVFDSETIVRKSAERSQAPGFGSQRPVRLASRQEAEGGPSPEVTSEGATSHGAATLLARDAEPEPPPGEVQELTAAIIGQLSEPSPLPPPELEQEPSRPAALWPGASSGTASHEVEREARHPALPNPGADPSAPRPPKLAGTTQIGLPRAVELSRQRDSVRPEPTPPPPEPSPSLPESAVQFINETNSDALVSTLLDRPEAGAEVVRQSEPVVDEGGPEIRPVLVPGRLSTFDDSLELSTSLDEERFFSQHPPPVSSPPPRVSQPPAEPWAERETGRRSLSPRRESPSPRRESPSPRRASPRPKGISVAPGERSERIPIGDESREQEHHYQPSRMAPDEEARKPASRSLRKVPWAPIVLTLITAGAAFAISSAVLGRLSNSSTTAQDEAPAAAASLGNALASSEPTGATPASPSATEPPDTDTEPVSNVPLGSQLAVEDRALPEGIEVSAGKGLLEVDTGQRHRIYIGGVFVGPGPVRRIPLSPGLHEVRLSLEGDERMENVEVKAGRRTWVGLSTGHAP